MYAPVDPSTPAARAADEALRIAKLKLQAAELAVEAASGKRVVAFVEMRQRFPSRRAACISAPLSGHTFARDVANEDVAENILRAIDHLAWSRAIKIRATAREANASFWE